MLLDSHSFEASCSYDALIEFHSLPAGAPGRGLSPEKELRTSSPGRKTRGGLEMLQSLLHIGSDTEEMAIGHLLCQWEPCVVKMQLITYQRKRI